MSDQGIAFRDTSGYVTDPANVTYCLAETYPVVRGGCTFGWLTSIVGNSRDRVVASGNLAGVNFSNGSTTPNFQLDLPATGSTDIHAAFGDAVSPNALDWLIQDTTTTIATISGVMSGADKFKDPTNVERTSTANWVSSEVAVTYTMASTALRIKSNSTSTNVIAFVRAVQGGGGGGTFLPAFANQNGQFIGAGAL